MRRPLLLLVIVSVLAGCARTNGAGGPGPGSSNPSSEPATELTVSAGSTPPPQQLPVGGTLHLTSQPSPNQPWAAFASSDESVLRCESTQHSDGSVTGTCTALAVGAATVSTTTAPFAGDPHGPPQYIWRVDVTVRAA